MSMIPMVLSRNGKPIVEVRHDAMENRVACVACKGRGVVNLHAGGNLWFDGISVWDTYFCDVCNGLGTWQED